MIYHLTNVIKDSGTFSFSVNLVTIIFESKIRKMISKKVDVTSGFDLEYEMNFIALNDFEEDIEFKFWASPTK